RELPSARDVGVWRELERGTDDLLQLGLRLVRHHHPRSRTLVLLRQQRARPHDSTYHDRRLCRGSAYAWGVPRAARAIEPLERKGGVAGAQQEAPARGAPAIRLDRRPRA